MDRHRDAAAQTVFSTVRENVHPNVTTKANPNHTKPTVIPMTGRS